MFKHVFATLVVASLVLCGRAASDAHANRRDQSRRRGVASKSASEFPFEDLREAQRRGQVFPGLPMESGWALVGSAIFYGTSIDQATANFTIPDNPTWTEGSDEQPNLAITVQIESIVGSEGAAIVTEYSAALGWSVRTYSIDSESTTTWGTPHPLSPGDTLMNSVAWNADEYAWEAKFTSGGFSNSSLTFDSMTLGAASYSLWFMESNVYDACSALPPSGNLKFTDIESDCGFAGCSGWHENEGTYCTPSVTASGNKATVYFSD